MGDYDFSGAMRVTAVVLVVVGIILGCAGLRGCEYLCDHIDIRWERVK